MSEDKKFEPMGEGPFVYDVSIVDRGTRRALRLLERVSEDAAVEEIVQHSNRSDQQARELLEFSRQGRGAAAYRKDDMSANVEITIQPYSKVAQNVMDQNDNARYNVVVYDLDHSREVGSMDDVTARGAISYISRMLDMPPDQIQPVLHRADDGHEKVVYNPKLSLEARVSLVPAVPVAKSEETVERKYDVTIFDYDLDCEIASKTGLSEAEAVEFFESRFLLSKRNLENLIRDVRVGNPKTIPSRHTDYEGRVHLAEELGSGLNPDADISTRRFAFTVFHARTGVPIFFNSDIDERTFRHALIDTFDGDDEKIDGIISLTKVGLLRLEFTPTDSAPMVLSAAAITD